VAYYISVTHEAKGLNKRGTIQVMKKDFLLQRSVLPNGMRVLLYPIDHVESVYVRLDLRIGSSFENDTNHGISHLIEHYLHQGNQLSQTSEDFALKLEENGIFQNGRTSSSSSDYYMKCPKDKFELALNELHAMILRPLFPKDRLDHVKKTVLNEYYDYVREPKNPFFEEFFNKRFTDKPPFMRNAIGTEGSIQDITLDQIQKFYKDYYFAGNFILTITGNFDTKKAQEKIESLFHSSPVNTSIQFPKVEKGHYSSYLITTKHFESDQIQFSLTLPGYGWTDRPMREWQALSLGTTILGSGRFSRLYRTIREKNNLVYWVSSSSDYYQTRGLISINGSCTKENLAKTLQLIIDEIHLIKEKGVTEKELETGKNIYIAGMTFGLETPEGIAGHLLHDEFWDQPIMLPNEYIDLLRSITVDEVNRELKILDTKNLNLALYGNLNKSEVTKTTNEIQKAI